MVYPVQQMTVKQVRWLFIGSLVVFFIVGEVSGPLIFGVSVEWTSGGQYRFSGGTAPWALAYAMMLIGLYAWFMSAAPRKLGQSLPGVLRRFVAFWTDFALAMSAIAPILGLLPAVTEWRRTGVFAWNFVRTTPAPGDDLLTAIELLFSCVALLLYFVAPLVLGKPSPGSCILGYQIISDEGKKLSFENALFRTLLGLIAILFAYFAPFIGRDREKGKFWVDKVFRTRAVILN